MTEGWEGRMLRAKGLRGTRNEGGEEAELPGHCWGCVGESPSTAEFTHMAGVGKFALLSPALWINRRLEQLSDP